LSTAAYFSVGVISAFAAAVANESEELKRDKSLKARSLGQNSQKFRTL
jgi:hypothetical protein